MSFVSDLNLGERGERHVATKLKQHYGATRICRLGACKGFDFRLIYKHREEKIETKTDVKAETTGNIYLEYECNGVPSGLASTEADKYSIYLPHSGDILVFCPLKMFKLLLSSKYRVAKGGDGYRVRGYLLPIKDAKDLDFVSTISSKRKVL